jgi:aldose 1-epimerase
MQVSMPRYLSLALLPLLFLSCARTEPTVAEKTDTQPTITSVPFGRLTSGEDAELFTLRNASGAEVSIANYGGIIQSLRVPDRNGKLANVVHGFQNYDGYLQEGVPYFGALIGRYGNRIANGSFVLAGTRYNVFRNNGPNALHGGRRGFDKVLWRARSIPDPASPALELTYVSADTEEGYPGELTSVVRYTLTPANELRLDYSHTTNKTTIHNITNHSYFNLAGEGDILKHRLTLYASAFTPVNSTLIPTGEIRKVAGTPFDFLTPHEIGERIDANDQQIRVGGGYDHNFVLDGEAGTLRPAARVEDPASGRVLDVLSTEPGVQFYTSNFLDGKLKDPVTGRAFTKRSAFCLETQHYPNSPNEPSFPSVVLRPGDRYTSTTVFRFSVAR